MPKPAALENDPLKRAFDATIDDVQPGERTVVFKINTSAIDSYRTVIDPLGGDLRAFAKNPVVLWEHGMDPVRGMPPIGKALWTKARKQAEPDILSKAKFADDEFSQGIFDLYRNDFLSGCSIRFDPDYEKCSPPTANEVRKRPDLADCRCMIRAWQLREYSAVAVPSNAEALKQAVSRGFWVPECVRSLLAAQPPTEQPPPEPEPELPLLVGVRLSDLRAARKAALRSEAEDLRARLDLRRGVV